MGGHLQENYGNQGIAQGVFFLHISSHLQENYVNQDIVQGVFSSHLQEIYGNQDIVQVVFSSHFFTFARKLWQSKYCREYFFLHICTRRKK